MNGWLVFGLLAAAYVLAFFYLRRREKREGQPPSASPYVGDVAERAGSTPPLDQQPFRAAHMLGGGKEEPVGFATMGPLIVWRTQFGKKAIQQVAKPGRFWNVVADVGVWVTWLTGAAIFALLLLSLAQYFIAPQTVAANAPPPEFLIGLPGINPLIPFGYGIAALVFALVIHEGSHGVMAYVAKMRVKSLGLVMFLVPIGAFVEPHEEDIMKATTRQKNRLFAAGPTSNLVLATVAGILLSTLFVGQMAVVNEGDGVIVGGIEEGSGAQTAGLVPGDLLVSVGGTKITDRQSYTDRMATTKAGERLPITYMREGQELTTVATLGDRYEYLRRVAPQLEDRPASEGGYSRAETQGKGFLGVSGIGLASLDLWREALEKPFGSFSNFFFYLGYPFFIFGQQIDLLASPFNGLFVVSGPLAGLPPVVFFGLAAFLYWLVWLNLMLGTFNALPAGPLDGGQMFRATLSERLMRRYRVDQDRIAIERTDVGQLHVKGKDAETQAKLDKVNLNVSRATRALGFFILGLILLPLFGPPLVRLLLA